MKIFIIFGVKMSGFIYKINYMRLMAFFVAFCFLINSCNFSDELHSLRYRDMQNYHQLRWEQDSTVLVFAGNEDLATKPVRISKGKYTLQFLAKGSIAANISPHFIIMLGDYVVRDMEIEEGQKTYHLNFELPAAVEAPMRFIFDNDYSDETGDRNIFLHFPVFIKPY